MKKIDLSKALNNIDDKYILEAAPKEKASKKSARTTVLMRAAAFVAAAAVIVLAVRVIYVRNQGGSAGATPQESINETYGAETAASGNDAEENGPVDDSDDHYSVDGNYAGDFPEDYAGEYVNEEGELVILDTSEALYNNSFNDLMFVMDEIYQYANYSEPSDEFTISSYSIDVENNSISVGIWPLTEESILAFKETVTDFVSVIFKEEDPNSPAED